MTTHSTPEENRPAAEFVAHEHYTPSSEPEIAARNFHDVMRQRRSVRFFSEKPVSKDVIESLIATAGTAPSGANKQPWHFNAIQDPAIKREIRIAAEAEEREFYQRRATHRWLEDLHPLGTSFHKPFLETAPWIIAVFKLTRNDSKGMGHEQVYYNNESVGIACGLFLAAAHNAGLATLTHTPSPMAFLSGILRRPKAERPYLLIPVGYPADDCVVPKIERKPLEEIMTIDRQEESSD